MKTLFDETGQHQEALGSDIIVACPHCHGTNAIRKAKWMETVRAERDKSEVQRDKELSAGRIAGFKCSSCKKKIANAEWHRAYERSQFQAKGWYTPRMIAS